MTKLEKGGDRMAATIDDVAKLAGCSITTVSRAYSQPQKVREETRERIFRAAEILRYSPNAIARAMVQQKNYNLAFVVAPKHYPIMLNPFYAEMAEAVQREAEELGYYVYITSTDQRKGAFDLFMNKRVDGVVLAGQTDQSLLSHLSTQGMPMVLANNRLDLTDVPSITSNDYSGATLAVEHLIRRGHTRIGLVAGQLFHYVTASRRQAYCDTLERHGIAVDPSYMYMVEPQQEDAMTIVDTILSQETPPTALFCMNDRIAIGAMKAALRRGLRIPDDLAVVGYDGSSLCTVIEPELTSVRVDTDTMGRMSARMLIDLIQGIRPARMQTVLQPVLVERGST